MFGIVVVWHDIGMVALRHDPRFSLKMRQKVAVLPEDFH